ncbi:MAG: hypothetical protein RIM23_07865 [Coleofasciculus sp. G3-WIS-01]|uniref:hypothetical protein n=1 Tax=Coleofasciculus sp. G3-WIS-01 TaxID=3069528 RepID=UPI0032F7A697
MNSSELRTKVLQEIQSVPDDKLIELLDLIHTFRLRSEPAHSPSQVIMKFAGSWRDLPNDTYTEFLNDISQRRQQAFQKRQNR